MGDAETMNCAKCGLKLPDRAVHCPNCFAPVRSDGLLRKLARALSFRAFGRSPVQVTTTRTTEFRTERFEVKDARTGQIETYASMADVPPEIRAQIEEARHAAERGAPAKITVKDASGTTTTYDSVDQMPPEIRALYERATKRQA